MNSDNPDTPPFRPLSARIVGAMRGARWWSEIRRQLLRRRMARWERLNRVGWWWLWLHLCGWNAEAVAQAIGRMSDPGIRFVQIGANDGRANDPLFDTVRRWRWRGLLVEPIPWVFERLVLNYSGVEGLAFDNVAISDHVGTMPMYCVERRDGDPEYFDQLFSFDESVVRSHRSSVPDFESRLQTTEVRTETLASLVARHDIDGIDLLHLDTEGYDLEILRQIDFEAPWAPRFIIFEVKHFGPDDVRAARNMLRRAGYRWFPIWHDALVYRRGPTQARQLAKGAPR